MGANSKIEWTHHTFNPWWGCIRVSPGCEHCYAEKLAKQYGHDVWGPAATTPRRFLSEQYWNAPLRWSTAAAAEGVRKRVFCASMADVGEDNPDVVRERARLARLIVDTPALDWLILSKRPENLNRLFNPYWGARWPDNTWAGTTVECQDYIHRAHRILEVPAPVHFLSVEPMLSEVNFRPLFNRGGGAVVRFVAALEGRPAWTQRPRIDWVIGGGESGGPAARRLVEKCPGMPYCEGDHCNYKSVGTLERPQHGCNGTGWRPKAEALVWVRDLRAQCLGANVAFLFKQWGGPFNHSGGRVLDGQLWDEYPGLKVAA